MFYAEVLKAMWGYISDKLTIPISELSRENVSQELRTYGASEELVSRIINIHIGAALSEYYREKLNMPEDVVVTIHDALLYELSISNYDYERVDDSDNVFYMLTPKVNDKSKKTYVK